MKRLMIITLMFCFFLISANSAVAETADFEDLSLNPESFWNGSDGGAGGFFSRGIAFNNNYVDDPNYPSWGGFGYSNKTGTLSDGFVAQYNAITGSGVDGSEIYAIGYYDAYNATYPTITLDEEQVVSGAYFTNNNYAYYSMTNGDGFAKKFTEADWFKVTITGFDANGAETSTVEFKLADGIDIVNTWTWVDLNGLGAVKKLTFGFSSSDSSEWGINTPAYFCMDSFNYTDINDDSSDGGCFIQSMPSDLLSW
jgi:hypothetical protein